jgi:hypothetical protein
VKALLALATCCVIGCASARPLPPALATAESAGSSPAVQRAAERAPQAHARAKALLERAEAAHRAGDAAGAQILAENATAAFEHAVVLSRLADAEARRGDAEARHARAERELFELDQQQRRELAEVEALELRARVLRDTEPLPTNAGASPARERARLDAAKSLSLQARLLCQAARLLDSGRPSLVPLLRDLDALDAKLGQNALPAPLDQATGLRSRCLAELGLIRRPRTAAAPAAGSGDALLAALSTSSVNPVRDDRGVVVTLRGAFRPDDSLDAKSNESLKALAQVAKAHPDFPILVVLHTAKGPGGEQDQRRLDQALSALRSAGAPKVEGALGGDRAPVVEPRRPGASERNARLEVVFVAPSST